MELTKKLQTIFKRYGVEVDEGCLIKSRRGKFDLNPVEFAVYKAYCISRWKFDLHCSEVGDPRFNVEPESYIEFVKDDERRAKRSGIQLPTDLKVTFERSKGDSSYLFSLMVKSWFKNLIN